MTERRGDTFASAIVECHHTTVAQRQLYASLTLLTCNLSRHRAVNLVGEPVLAGHGLKLEDVGEIVVQCRVKSIE